MILGILKEPEHENRVAMLPELISGLNDLKVEIYVQKGAGEKAMYPDEEYTNAGAQVLERSEIIEKADVLVQITPPSEEEINAIPEGKVLISVLNPLWNKETVKQIRDKNITCFSLDAIPRTTRAQAMDVLSSMATVAGYRAVLTAALHLPKFFPMFMTAAGTIKPAKVLVLGAGVAGLQAIATARKLGAQVEAFDVRSAVKEEVMSLGAKFVEVEGAIDDKSAGGYAVEQTEEYKQKQAQVIHEHAVKADVIICTAQIPGKRAPLLVKKETVAAMQKGSVIVDLAASTGGNCELTQNDKVIKEHGVTIVGQSNFPSTMPLDASRMFGKNLVNFFKLIIGEEGALHLNFEDDIVKGACITYQKEIINERVKSVIES